MSGVIATDGTVADVVVVVLVIRVAVNVVGVAEFVSPTTLTVCFAAVADAAVRVSVMA